MQKAISGKLVRFFALFAASAALVLAFCAPSSAFADGLYRDSYNLLNPSSGDSLSTGSNSWVVYDETIPSGIYTLNVDKSAYPNAYCYLSFSNGSNAISSCFPFTFTVPEGLSISRVSVYGLPGIIDRRDFASNAGLMLNAGSSALPYEPYGVEQMDVGLIASWFSGMGKTFLGFLGSNTGAVFLVVGAVCIIFLVVTFARKKVLRG